MTVSVLGGKRPLSDRRKQTLDRPKCFFSPSGGGRRMPAALGAPS